MSTVAHALAGVSTALVKSQSDGRERPEEVYTTEIINGLLATMQRFDAGLFRSLMRYFKIAAATQPRATDASINPPTRRSSPRLRLDQSQLDELAMLIQFHFRSAVYGASSPWQIDPVVLARWKRQGLIAPSVDFAAYTYDALVAGRLAHILPLGATYAELKALSQQRPMPRQAQLIAESAQGSVAMTIMNGIAQRTTNTVLDLVQMHQRAVLLDTVGRFRAGTLKPSLPNRDRLSPEAAKERGDAESLGTWQGLARDLRNRFKAVDRDRDWERLANSSVRLTQSMGTMQAMAEDGVEFCKWMVQPTACTRCKKTYLNPDGTPRKFAVAAMLEQMLATGGINPPKSPPHSPNALLHPWCQCRVVRWIEAIDAKKPRP